MTLVITALYACALAVLAIILGARVSILRAKTGISILAGDNKQMAERMRQHGNLAENLPLALILMGLAEMNGASGTWMHAIGIALLVGRLIHPFGISMDNPKEVARGIGSALTTLSMLIAIVYLLWTLLG